MTQQKQHQESISNSFNQTPTIIPSPSKSDIQIKREKRQKSSAFKTFLTKIQPAPLDNIPRRKLSGQEITQQHLSIYENCKICQQALGEKTKLCEFCKDVVCASHIRKKRRNPTVNKFNRICDFCEDKYLIEKHYKNQMKTQESLVTQELVLQTKYKEIKQILDSKRIKFQLLTNKKNELESYIKKQTTRMITQQNQIEKKTKKLNERIKENAEMEIMLKQLELTLPPSSQNDFNFLVQQNNRITKDLVKSEKMCNDAIKARCQKQKQMYEQYYEWEVMQKLKICEQQKKEEECCIY